MAKEDITKKVISKWVRSHAAHNGGKSQQVVYKTEIGKNKKGKIIYSSQTRHERIS